MPYLLQYLALECWSELIFSDELNELSDADKYQALMTLSDLSTYFKETRQDKEFTLSSGILAKFANQFELPGGEEFEAQFQQCLETCQTRDELINRLTVH